MHVICNAFLIAMPHGCFDALMGVVEFGCVNASMVSKYNAFHLDSLGVNCAYLFGFLPAKPVSSGRPTERGHSTTPLWFHPKTFVTQVDPGIQTLRGTSVS